MANHFTVMLNGVTANQAALGAIGATLVQRATDLHDNWVTIYNASEAATGEKTATKQDKRDARFVLQWDLYENLNEITSIFPRQPDKVELYMRQALLGFPVDSAPDGDGGDPDPDPDPEESSSSSSYESSSSSEPEPPLSSSSSSSSSSSFFFSSSSSGP